MFESIVANITNLVRNAVRTVVVAVRERPWLAPAAIIAFFVIW